jgi:hypothetical protein
VRFYLGTHHPSQAWFDAGVPLFVSRRRLTDRKTLPTAQTPWALDSGGFTELDKYGGWRTTEDAYVADVRRFALEVGLLEWVAPMDWMCEPHMLAKTGLTVRDHQYRTVANFCRLRERLGDLVVPVLQGWSLDDYLRCWDAYERREVDLEAERVIGLGTVCRRQNTAEVGRIVRTLADAMSGPRIHGFGVKVTGLESFGDVLASADSMAWSYDARMTSPLPGCTHRACSNCLRYALRWRATLEERLSQQRLDVAA